MNNNESTIQIKQEVADEIAIVQNVFEVEIKNEIKIEEECDFPDLINYCSDFGVKEENVQNEEQDAVKFEVDQQLSDFASSNCKWEDEVNNKDLLEICKEPKKNSNVNSIHVDSRRKINCEFCHKCFVAKRSRDDHLLKQHKKEIENDIGSFVSYKIHTCNICSYQTTLQIDLSNHIKAIHNKEKTKVKCQFCDKSFIRKLALDDHILKHHKQDLKVGIKDFITNKIHKCKICSYETTHKHLLPQHIISIHKNKQIKLICQFCDKSFTKKCVLDDHLLKQHKNEKTNSFITSKIHTCNLCTYKTTNNGLLAIHINAIHNKEKVKTNCQFCGKAFARKQAVDDHMLKQHKHKIKFENCITSKIHACNLCSFVTTHKAGLLKHTYLSHKNESSTKQINCQFCNKSFRIKHTLDNHLLKQHKQDINEGLITSKIFTCTMCSYKTTHKCNLNMHIESMHNEQRTKMKCGFCDKKFVKKYSLNDHLLKQHKEKIESDLKNVITNKIYACKLCSYESTRKTRFQEHMNSNHKK